MDVKLFHAPGACSRVTLNALEEIGLPFETVAVNIFRGEQNELVFRKINPKGRVPALAVDGNVMTENAAILHYLNVKFPAARLLPTAAEPEADQALLSDLVWCSSTLHPLVRQIRNPARLTDGEVEQLRTKGIALLTELMEKVDERLTGMGPWWHGENWSIVDVYLFWVCDVAASGGFDLARFSGLVRHAAAVRERPSFQRARAREMDAAEQLGIVFPPGFVL